MIPQPWSPSKLGKFVTCPRQFEAIHVLKTVKDETGREGQHGLRVHKEFELAQKLKTPEKLPSDLAMHAPFMRRLYDLPGFAETEGRYALNRKLKPTAFHAEDVWARLVIDYHKLNGDTCLTVDYKTGKQHNDWKQLALYALYLFAQYPQVRLVNAQYYWCQTKKVTKKIWDRKDIPTLWQLFIPDLKQYVEAHKTNTWQPRPSGLCHGFCPVQDCEYWQPKKKVG